MAYNMFQLMLMHVDIEKPSTRAQQWWIHENASFNALMGGSRKIYIQSELQSWRTLFTKLWNWLMAAEYNCIILGGFFFFASVRSRIGSCRQWFRAFRFDWHAHLKRALVDDNRKLNLLALSCWARKSLFVRWTFISKCESFLPSSDASGSNGQV